MTFLYYMSRIINYYKKKNYKQIELNLYLDIIIMKKESLISSNILQIFNFFFGYKQEKLIYT